MLIVVRGHKEHGVEPPNKFARRLVGNLSESLAVIHKWRCGSEKSK
jgi:hypothetical protein